MMSESAGGGAGEGVVGSDLAWSRERSEEVGEYRHFRVRRDWYRSPRDGGAHDFYVLDMPDWVQVLAVTEVGGLVLVEQFRPGSRRVTLEFPAGIVDPGEAPVAAAVRELAEETGFRGGRAELVGTFDPNPALQNNRLFVVLVDGCQPTAEREQDPGEVIGVREATVEEMASLVAEGTFDTAFGLVAWDCYRRLRRAG
jgi:ADP-ribose pyrophosphatase